MSRRGWPSSLVLSSMLMQNLLDLPHSRARRLVTSGAPVFLSVNPVEYHGPHLSLHNDRLISEGLIADLHKGLLKGHDWPLLFAGDLEVGVDPVPGPGSRPVPFRQVCRLVEDACRSLRSLGSSSVVLMTFHGSPMQSLALEKGVALLQQAGVPVAAPFNLLMRAILQGAGAAVAEAYAGLEDDQLQRAMLDEATRDLHAGYLETSLSLHYAPASVEGHEQLPPCPSVIPQAALSEAARGAGLHGKDELAAELSLLAWGKSWFSLDPFPGYTGRPHLASAEAGATVARAIVEEATGLVEAIIEGRARSPKPAFAWLGRITIGGRITLPLGPGPLDRLAALGQAKPTTPR